MTKAKRAHVQRFSVLASAPSTVFDPEQSQGALLLGNEWAGMAIDFIANNYAVRVYSNAEALLGSGPYTRENGLTIDFLDNSNAVGT